MDSAPERPGPVSAIICNYNRSRDLPPIVDALRRTTAPLREVLIVDDGSTDQPEPVYADLAARSLPFALQVLRNPENLGASASRNRGMREAKGDILALIDSDATFEPETLSLLWAALDGADCTFPTARYQDGAVFNPTDRLSRECCLNSVMFMIRKQALARLNEWFDEDMKVYGEDPDFFLRAHAVGIRIRHVPEAVVTHPRRRVHSASEFYLGYKNTVYMALKLRGIIRYRHSCVAVVISHTVRFFLSALTGYYFAGMRPTRERFAARRRELFRLFFKAIRWNINQRAELRRKRSALRSFLQAA